MKSPLLHRPHHPWTVGQVMAVGCALPRRSRSAAPPNGHESTRVRTRPQSEGCAEGLYACGASMCGLRRASCGYYARRRGACTAGRWEGPRNETRLRRRIPLGLCERPLVLLPEPRVLLHKILDGVLSRVAPHLPMLLRLQLVVGPLVARAESLEQR